MKAVAELLQAIYGPETARQWLPKLTALIEAERLAAPCRQPGGRAVLTERDALLITYADQVTAPGQSPLACLREFARQNLKNLVSGIHLLPFYPFSSDDGFSVMDYYAVHPDFGAWEDVRRLGQDFDLMFDAVFNHLSAQGEWFGKFLAGDPAFRDFFVTVVGNPDLSRVIRPRALPLLTEFSGAAGPLKVWTTFSADQVDLNLRHPPVLLELIKVLLFYIRQGARFIRLDAIAFLWKEIGTSCLHLRQTHQIIQLFRAVLDELYPAAVLITETNVPHRDNISYFGDGRNEAQLVYNFALPPLTLHAAQTGDAAALTRWAAALEFPSAETTYFNFLASHDGIGLNPARGLLSEAEIGALVQRTLERGGLISYKHNPDGSRSPYELNITWFDALNPPEAPEPVESQVRRFMVTQAIMLALRGVPGVYFHSLFGSRNDRAAADSSGIPRRINRQKFSRSRLERELAEAGSVRARVFAAYQQLLRARSAHPAFSPVALQEVVEADRRAFCFWRVAAGGAGRVLCAHNVSGQRVQLRVPAASPPGARFGDLAGQGECAAGPEGLLEFALEPWQTRWLAAASG